MKFVLVPKKSVILGVKVRVELRKNYNRTKFVFNCFNEVNEVIFVTPFLEITFLTKL